MPLIVAESHLFFDYDNDNDNDNEKSKDERLRQPSG